MNGDGKAGKHWFLTVSESGVEADTNDCLRLHMDSSQDQRNHMLAQQPSQTMVGW